IALLDGDKERGDVKVWDLHTGALVLDLDRHSAGVTCVQFSNDGLLLASASRDQSVKIWDTKTGALVEDLRGHKVPVNSVAFHPTAPLLASGGGDVHGLPGELILWELATGVAHELKGSFGPVYCVGFNSEGSSLAAGGEKIKGGGDLKL